MRSITLFAAVLLVATALAGFGQPPLVDDVASSAAVASSSDVLPAQRADDFVDSVGVNTHLSYSDTAYDRIGDVRRALAYLRVRHIRDAIEDGAGDRVIKRFRGLAQLGVKVTGVVPYETTSMRRLIRQVLRQRDVLEAVEGPNETDIFTQFSYRGQGFPEGTIAFMEDFYPAIKSTPGLRRLEVLQTTLAFPGQELDGGIRADLLGDLSDFADYGNSHNYFSFGEPPSGPIKRQHLPLNSRITPGKLMVSSEGGYQMGRGDGYKGTWDDGQSARFSEDVHGRYMLRYLLEQYRLGYRRSFLYELLSIDQPDWGLFRRDGSPRPAAVGIHNLLGILGEGRRDAPAFAPGTLDVRLGQRPPSVHTLLLQKSNSTFYLVMWNDVRNWDPRTATPIARPDVPVTLRVEEPVARVRTFLPLTDGTDPTSTSSRSSLEISVPDHPVIVEITRP